MKVLKWIGIVAVALIVAGILAVTALVASRVISDHNTNVAQAQLDPFYTPPAPLPQTLGTVIRTEPLGITVQGGTAQRFLYVSETPTGTRAASGAMIFIPSTPAPRGDARSWPGRTAPWGSEPPAPHLGPQIPPPTSPPGCRP